MTRAQELLDAATLLPWSHRGPFYTEPDVALILHAVNALPAYEAARELLLRWRDASLAEDAFVLGELTNETTDLLASLEAEA